jgi:diphthine synthase
MLTIAGLGLWDEKDLTLRAIDAAKKADKVYIEMYTSKWHGLDGLKEVIGNGIVEMKREDLEQGIDRLVEEAKDKDVVLFVPGDPLVATTHLTILETSKNAGIETRVIHNSSIISSIAETGLHIYKFGATATVPFPEKTKNKLPESVYDTLKLNKRAGLHTLLLLDIIPERCMLPKEAMQLLLATEEQRKEGIFTKQTQIAVFARAGSEDSEIFYGKVGELLDKDFGKPPMVMVVPGVLHFTEREYLSKFQIDKKQNPD